MLPINTNRAPAAVGPYSQAVMKNNMVYVSGTLGMDTATGQLPESFTEQARNVLNHVKAVLEGASMNMSHVVKVSIFLADMNDFAELNEIYKTYFIEPYPARETVQVARLPKDARVEISVIASR